jgi:hypothetical protein
MLTRQVFDLGSCAAAAAAATGPGAVSAGLTWHGLPVARQAGVQDMKILEIGTQLPVSLACDRQ